VVTVVAHGVCCVSCESQNQFTSVSNINQFVFMMGMDVFCVRQELNVVYYLEKCGFQGVIRKGCFA
jgi:hypothetical protein